MLTYLVFILTLGGIYALLALSLNLIWGSVGMVNLGLAGVFAVGAYASALLTGAGWPLWSGLLAAIVLAGAAGILVTVTTSRLRDDYLAIVTLGFAEFVRLIASNEIWLTHGTDGISGIFVPLKATFWTLAAVIQLVIISVVVAVIWALCRALDASPYGRVLRAIRDDARIAAVAGKPVLRYKIQAFAISAGIAGLAGAMYGHFTSYIAPDIFQPLITIYIFLAVTAGGVGRPTGAVFGAYTVILFVESTRFLTQVFPGLAPVRIASLREMGVGLALLILLRLRPQGVFPERIRPAPRYTVPRGP